MRRVSSGLRRMVGSRRADLAVRARVSERVACSRRESAVCDIHFCAKLFTFAAFTVQQHSQGSNQSKTHDKHKTNLINVLLKFHSDKMPGSTFNLCFGKSPTKSRQPSPVKPTDTKSAIQTNEPPRSNLPPPSVAEVSSSLSLSSQDVLPYPYSEDASSQGSIRTSANRTSLFIPNAVHPNNRASGASWITVAEGPDPVDIARETEIENARVKYLPIMEASMRLSLDWANQYENEVTSEYWHSPGTVPEEAEPEEEDHEAQQIGGVKHPSQEKLRVRSARETMNGVKALLENAKESTLKLMGMAKEITGPKAETGEDVAKEVISVKKENCEDENRPEKNLKHKDKEHLAVRASKHLDLGDEHQVEGSQNRTVKVEASKTNARLDSLKFDNAFLRGLLDVYEDTALALSQLGETIDLLEE